MEPLSNGYLGPVDYQEDEDVASSAVIYELPDSDLLPAVGPVSDSDKLPNHYEDDIKPVSSEYLEPAVHSKDGETTDSKDNQILLIVSIEILKPPSVSLCH